MARNPEQQRVDNRALQLYRTFFFGDELSDMEKSIENQYLTLKQRKYQGYRERGVNYQKSKSRS